MRRTPINIRVRVWITATLLIGAFLISGVVVVHWLWNSL